MRTTWRPTQAKAGGDRRFSAHPTIVTGKPVSVLNLYQRYCGLIIAVDVEQARPDDHE
jgi:hypothetical protein